MNYRKNFQKTKYIVLQIKIRRSSRSVCANFAEALRRRKYPAHFLSKLSDSDSENAETEVWIDFPFTCKYISQAEHFELKNDQTEVGRLLGDILKSPEKYS